MRHVADRRTARADAQRRMRSPALEPKAAVVHTNADSLSTANIDDLGYVGEEIGRAHV